MNALPIPTVRYQVKVTFTLPNYSGSVVYEVPIITDVFPLEGPVRMVLADTVPYSANEWEMDVSRIEILQTVPAII